jgi:hypothetical protein
MTILARQRFIHPSIWDDKKIAKLTFVERLFFIGCFSSADDDGRLIGDPAYLRSIIFKYDDVTLEEVTRIRNNVLSICKNLVLYVVDGEEYLTFIKWKNYQKPKYPTPSKIPPFPGDFREPSGNSSGNHSGNIEGSTPQRVGLGLGRDGLGSDLDNSINKAAATTIQPIVIPEPQKPAADAAAGPDDNLLNALDNFACEVLGRVCTSPLDIEAMKQMLEATNGDLDLISKKVREMKENFEPKFKGDRIKTFKYFLSGVQEEATLQKARAAPIPIDKHAQRPREPDTDQILAMYYRKAAET